MDPEQLKAFMDALEALRADITQSISAVDAKCDALAGKMKKADDDEANPNAATRVAADSVSRAELRQLHDRVSDVAAKQRDRPPADRDALADLQARADVAYRCLGEGAPPPMLGEAVVDYAVRLHRPLQKHSGKFKAAELAVIARDPTTFNSVLDSIRADAYAAGMNPVGLPEFQHREIKTESPGGHRITSFVGTGTIFKQMARPVRHIKSIGHIPGMARTGGGSMVYDQR